MKNRGIPGAWELVPLKELGQWSGGGTPSKAKPEYWRNGKIPWVSPKDMKTDRITDSEDHITKAAVEESTAKLIAAGSVLVVTRSGILSHTLPVAVTTVPVTVNQDLKALTPKDGVLPEYVAWALRCFAREILNTCSKQGTTVNSIETAALHRFEIPVAPLDQQKRIVAEIEKQFSRLDEAVASLKRVKANLKRYKAAVLKAAVEGRLVETEAELAAQGRANVAGGTTPGATTRQYESGEQLLKRILAERRRKWEENELAKMKAQGKVPKDDKWKGKYKEPAIPDTTGLPELPEGWVWATVQQLADVQLGKMLDRQKHRSGKALPYFRNINVRWDSVDSSDLLTMYFKESEFDRYGLHAGDVLVCEGGEPGRAALWNGREPGMMYQKAIHRVRFIGGYQQRILVFYLEFMAKTGRLERWFTGSTIKHFTRESFAQLPIPVAPAAEQLRIVAEVDRRLSLIRETEAQVDTNLQRADRLRQAILTKAFSGLLVEHWCSARNEHRELEEETLMEKERPKFRKPKAVQSYATPEELFAKLPNRAKSHGYLRGPQTDALRDYVKLEDKSDIACELPTGTGKTTVGLLIAEWRRRQTGERVAYLTLTNQLARQVLREAESLGVDCANLIGTKETRDAGEVGRYATGRAIGVTTFSNLFNVNPVVQASNVLVFDDAHGGEHYVAAMWTVRIDSEDNKSTYQDVLAALRPSLSDSQYRVVTDEAEYAAVELADVHTRANVLTNVTAVLDEAGEASIRFPWSVIRNNLNACLFFVSGREIVIRPITPPTHTHPPFNETKQRIYMSATLGGEGDLLRGYGITSIETIRVKHAQWGRRYIFMPSLYFEEDECPKVVSSIWNGMSTHRALILAPSFTIADRTFKAISAGMTPKPTKLIAKDIENSLDSFTTSESAVLCLAGRYDGVDLPGDDCRLLVMAESPGAIGALERHLREHWKLGPLLRRRERTRLIQGMGRCTRDATDFAVIILLGQSLIDSITPPVFSKTLPGEIQRELSWGMEQGEAAREDSDALTDMVVGLLGDEEYRKDANESIAEMDVPERSVDELGDEESGKAEVLYLRAMWGDDYTGGYHVARRAADDINKPELAGYRAWWLYLASIAAQKAGENDGEIDCLKRAKAIGINSGFLDSLLRLRSRTATKPDKADSLDVQAESIWNQIASWGWQGPAFKKKLDEMMTGLSQPNDHTRFHIGLERLGQCLGAEAIRSTAEGAPDVVWIFHNRCYTFEAKAGTRLSKKYVQQARGHVEWVRAQRPELNDVPIQPLVVSPDNKVEDSAKPHIAGLNFLSTTDIAQYGQNVAAALQNLRTQFAGKDYGAASDQLKAEIQQAKMDCGSVEKLLSTPL